MTSSGAKRSGVEIALRGHHEDDLPCHFPEGPRGILPVLPRQPLRGEYAGRPLSEAYRVAFADARRNALFGSSAERLAGVLWEWALPSRSASRRCA